MDMTSEHLIQIEAIKQLKARYFRLLDTKQWELWADVFTEDFQGVLTGPHPDIELASREDMIRSAATTMEGVVVIHHGHMPEITIHDEENASGIWSMFDHVEIPGSAYDGYGHYHEEYRKCEDGKWRIRSLKLTRLATFPVDDGEESR